MRTALISFLLAGSALQVAAAPYVKRATVSSALAPGITQANASPCSSREFYDRNKKACVKCADSSAVSCNENGASDCGQTMWIQAGKCVKDCVRAYKDPVSGSKLCIACADTDASKCNSQGATACTLKFLQGKNCVDASLCVDGTFADVATHTCKPCLDLEAAKCPGGVSTLCKSNNFLQAARDNMAADCKAACNDGFYGKVLEGKDYGICEACIEGTATCDAGGSITCSPNYFKLVTSTSRTCVQDCGARVGLYEKAGSATGGTCAECSDQEAAECSGDVSSECKSDNFLQAARDDKAADCKAACDDGFYGKVLEGKDYGTCEACAEGTATCDAGGSITCSPNYFKLVTSTSRTCVQECGARVGLYEKGGTTGGICAECSDHEAAECPGDVSSECTSNNFLQAARDDKAADCKAPCDDGFYGKVLEGKDYGTCEACTEGTATCDAGGSITCSPDYFKLVTPTSRTCVKVCGDGLYEDAMTRTCKACTGFDAKTCPGDVTSACLTLFLSGNTCVATCPTRTYPSLNVCRACSDEFATACPNNEPTDCSGDRVAQGTPSQCLPCARGLYKDGRSCSSCAIKHPESLACTFDAPTECSPESRLTTTAPIRCNVPAPGRGYSLFKGYSFETSPSRSLFVQDKTPLKLGQCANYCKNTHPKHVDYSYEWQRTNPNLGLQCVCTETTMNFNTKSASESDGSRVAAMILGKCSETSTKAVYPAQALAACTPVYLDGVNNCRVVATDAICPDV